MKIFPLAALFTALALTSACEDPSNVGIGLIDESGGRPVTRQLPPRDLREEELARTLGTARRIVVGAVNDPLLGSIEARSYVDFIGTTNSGFRAGTVQSAELRLFPSYTFGDTTSALTVAVREIQSSWVATGLPADTNLSVGPVITQFTFDPTDSLVVVALPADWVQSKDAVLRSQTFGSDFHGLLFEYVGGDAVAGFNLASRLQARTQADSALFEPSIIYLAGRRESPSTLPQSRLLIQAGAGPAAAFTLDLDPLELPVSAVSSATLAFRVDTLALQQSLPSGYVRPTISMLDLFAITPEGSPLFLARGTLADGTFRFNSRALATELQRMLLGEAEFDRFELRLPAPPSVPETQSEARLLTSSVNALVLFTADSGEQSPRGVITITPLDE